MRHLASFPYMVKLSQCTMHYGSVKFIDRKSNVPFLQIYKPLFRLCQEWLSTQKVGLWRKLITRPKSNCEPYAVNRRQCCHALPVTLPSWRGTMEGNILEGTRGVWVQKVSEICHFVKIWNGPLLQVELVYLHSTASFVIQLIQLNWGLLYIGLILAAVIGLE